MKIFGIDAGLTAPGFAVVETSDNNSMSRVLFAECFIPQLSKEARKKSKTSQNINRIEQISTRILAILALHKPDVVVVELPTGGAKSGAAMRGMAFATATTVAALKIAAECNACTKEIVYITPIANKKGSTQLKTWHADPGQGKQMVVDAVKKIWPDVTWPVDRSGKPADAKCWAIADALSCVATYLNSSALDNDPE